MPGLNDELYNSTPDEDNDPQKGVSTDGNQTRPELQGEGSDQQQGAERPEPDEAGSEGQQPAGERLRPADGGSDDRGSDGQQQQDSVTQATIPLPVLQEERRKRQALEQRLHERDASFDRLNERLERLNQAVKQNQQPSPPNVDEDPVAWLQHGHTQLTEKIDALGKSMQGIQEANTAQQANMQLAQMEQQFRTAHPDYDKALEHLTSNVDAQLGALGLTSQEQQQQKQQYFSFIVQQATQSGQNPAQVVYDMATGIGFQSQVANQGVGGGGNGAAGPDPHLVTVAKGQAANRTMQQAGGKTERKLTLDALDDMDDDEFDAATSGNKWRKLWQGAG